jgi:hypothetical protein
MSGKNDDNPLLNLIGVWKGDKGTDLAPKPVEDEKNPYYETLTIETVDIDIENAGKQQLIAVRYHQTVTEKASGDVSHDETGYWIWNKEDGAIMLAFAIPRGVSVLASGQFERLGNDSDEIKIQVSAKLNSANPGIVQSPFMSDKAKTTEFKRELRISGNTLSYTQETTLDIYDKVFNHADDNTLQRT